MFSHPEAELDKPMDSLLDYLSVFAVVDHIQVELDSEYLFGVLHSDCVLVVVIDCAEVIVVGDQQFINCLVQVRSHD